MRFSTTLSLYVVRSLLLNLFYVFLAFCFISFILDLLELIRKVQGKEILILQILKIAFYKVPFLIFSFLPFIFLFGSILTFTKLNNSFEIAAAKSVGISIWSLGAPIIGAVLVLSLLILLAFQPISAIFLDKNRILENKYFDYKSNRVSLNSNGIWLYDQTSDLENEKFIIAKNVTKNGASLSDARLYLSGSEQNFTTSYIADIISIEDGLLIIQNATKYSPGLEIEYLKQIILPTNLIANQIQESIVNPEIIPFWDLDNFITQIKQSGFSTLKHELYYKSLLVSPILYISLVLIALSCSINLPRSGKLGVVFVIGSIIAIFIYFVEKMVNVMALTAVLPINIAVLAPSIAYLLLSSAVLIHYEEE